MKKTGRSLNIAIITLTVLILISFGLIVFFYISQTKTTTSNISINDIQVLDSETARSTVKSFYDKYLQAANNIEKSTEIVREYGSKNLLEYYEKNQKNGPVVCSTEIPQKTIVIKSDIKDGVTASVFVEQQFKDSKKIVEVNLKKDNGIKIDSINCSPDLTQNP